MMLPPPYNMPSPAARFPKRTFKGMAGTTIALGILCVIIAVSQSIYSVTSYKRCMPWAQRQREARWERQWVQRQEELPREEEGWENYDDTNENNENYVDLVPEAPRIQSRKKRSMADWNQWEEDDRCSTMEIAGLCGAGLYLICGVLFIVAGSLGVGAAKTTVNHRRSGLKMGYAGMNMLNAVIFGPVLFIGGTAMACLCSDIVLSADYYMGHKVMGALMAIAGLVMTLLAIVASSIACCCAPTTDDHGKHSQMFTIDSTMHQMAPMLLTPSQQVASQVQSEEKVHLSQ